MASPRRWDPVKGSLLTMVDLLLEKGYVYLAANNEDGMETSWVHKSVEIDINRQAIHDAGWKIGSTKWITVVKDGKLQVNEPKKKKRGKK